MTRWDYPPRSGVGPRTRPRRARASSPATSRWVPLIVVIGILITQAGWILAVIPFSGIDEPDQVFRAASVARGHWLADEPAPGGRGGLVDVPPDVVDAARAQCEALSYNKAVNCTGAGSTPDGLVRVGSGANRYHPAFYWALGTAARPFHGVAALYAMRIVAAMVCALGIGVVSWCLTRSSPGRWPIAGLVAGASPVLVFSTVMPAPNGLEMVAGLLLWSGLLALGTERRRGDGWVVLWATIGAVLLVTLRALGPLFAVLVLGCVLLARWPQASAVVRAHGRALGVGLVVSVAATLGALAWNLSAQPFGQHDGDPTKYPYTDLLKVIPTGLLQSIAAAPGRNDPAPILVYPLYLVVIVAVLVAGLRRGPRRGRVTVLVAVTLSFVVPLEVSALGLRSVGLIWQGRYGLPFTAGILLLAGILAQRAGVRVPSPGRWAIAGCYLVAQVVACAGTFAHQQALTVAPTPGWIETSTATVALVSAVGFGVLLLAVAVSAPRETEGVAHEATPDRPVLAQRAEQHAGGVQA